MPETEVGYQLTVSPWGAAIILAGLESLLEHDSTLRIEQRVPIKNMTVDLRKLLKQDIVIEQDAIEEVDVPELESGDSCSS